jgi:hypothetical protein
MGNHYVHYAWANGDKALQAGRWPHISHRLAQLEGEFPGIRAAVLARLERLKQSIPIPNHPAA